MDPEIADVQRTLEFAQSHELARRFLPAPFVGAAIGLVLVTPFDGRDVEGGPMLLGSAVILISLASLGVIIYRRMSPSVPSIVLSPQGILFRDLSEKVIPWNEIRSVGIAFVQEARDFNSTKVTKLTVSKGFFRMLTAGHFHLSVMAVESDAPEIYLSYYHRLPFDEFHGAVQRRWHAFSHHASGKTLPPEFAIRASSANEDTRTLAGSRGPAPRTSGIAIERAQSFPGFRAFAALLGSSSPVSLSVTAFALAAIVALVTNNMGLWSTQQQIEGRARAAEWRQWNERFEADRKAMDEKLEKDQQERDKAFACMDQYWSQHELGTYTKDPDCMKNNK
ncbi:MAG: hypothetical protein NW216_07880 [Hyphomicrobium sp.]|nr:hypothetical protein [Hyphomicrobium sp.]